MAEDWQDGQEYLFSGKFPLPVSFPDKRKVRAALLFVQESRKSLYKYSSDKTNPRETFLASFTECRDDFVLCRNDVRYDLQIYAFGEANTTQLYYLLRCSFAAVIDRIAVIGGVLGSVLPPFSNADIFTPINYYPDVLKFVCYKDTAIHAKFKYLLYDECENDTLPPPPPPPPPPPAPRFPSGEPITLSDGLSPRPPGQKPEDYEPFPGDVPPPPDPDQGEECEILTVTFTVDYLDTSNNPQSATNTLTVFGEASYPFIAPSTPGLNPVEQVFITCRGIVELGQICGESATNPVTNYDTRNGITAIRDVTFT